MRFCNVRVMLSAQAGGLRRKGLEKSFEIGCHQFYGKRRAGWLGHFLRHVVNIILLAICTACPPLVGISIQYCVEGAGDKGHLSV